MMAQSGVDPTRVIDQSPPSNKHDRWLSVVLVVGYLLQVGWRIYLSRNLITPAAHADEDGYLIAARALAGGPGGETTENGAFRRMGYPMLIAPVYWFVADAFKVYRGVLIVNAVLNAAVFPLAFLFARRVLDLPRRTALAGGFVAALLPAVVFYAEFAMTDAIIAVIGMGWILLAHQWLIATTTRGRLIGALGSGTVAGFFSVVHVRGTMVVLAHVMLVAGLLALRRTGWKLALASVVAAGVATQLDTLLKAIVGDAMVSAGRSPKSQTINAITSLHGVARTIGGADGQFWYLCVATLGIGAVALVASVLPLLTWAGLKAELAERVSGARRITVTAVLATTLLIAVGSAAALPPGDARLNYAAYPRYIHLFFPIWLLIGLVALREAAPLRRRLVLLCGSAAGFTVLCGAVVYVRLQDKHGAFLPFDAPETSFLGWRWTAMGVVRPMCVALLVLASFTAVLWLRPKLGLPVVLTSCALVQLVSMPMVVQEATLPMEASQYLATTPRLAREDYLRPGDVVAYARDEDGFYYQYNVAREVNWTALLLFDQTTQPVPAKANTVIAPYRPINKKLQHWDGTPVGFTLVVVDPEHHWALWRRNPGPTRSMTPLRLCGWVSPLR